MFLLLPFLLLTTSVQKLVGLDLRIPSSGDLPPELPGAVEDLTVRATGKELTVQASVRKSDVGANIGETEARVVEVAADGEALDLAGLQAALRTFKRLDPERTRLLLVPADEVPGRDVVLLMDAVRADGQGELFPEVALGGIEASPGEELPADAPLEPSEGSP